MASPVPRALAGSAGAAALLVLTLSPRPARAVEAPEERPLTPEEVQHWLDNPGTPGAVDSGTDVDAPPPSPPHRRGFVVESSVGAFGHLGEMKHVSPTAPWFRLQFGYEPWRWLLVFAESDLVLSTTSYARPPPAPRSYALIGFGSGLRFTLKPVERFGIYLQGSLGFAEVTGDVLATYGYRAADQFNLYAAGELGLEWYQPSPHMALALHGGIRDYASGFKREQSGQLPLAWVSGIALRYTF